MCTANQAVSATANLGMRSTTRPQFVLVFANATQVDKSTVSSLSNPLTIDTAPKIYRSHSIFPLNPLSSPLHLLKTKYFLLSNETQC